MKMFLKLEQNRYILWPAWVTGQDKQTGDIVRSSRVGGVWLSGRNVTGQQEGRHAFGSSGAATGGTHPSGAVCKVTFPQESFRMDRVRRLCKKED
jgi:hypothetical protein